MGTHTVAATPQRLAVLARLAACSLREDGLAFLTLWPRVQTTVPGWLFGPDAWLLYDLARRGPADGAIVEIGSAWGRSTVFLASGSKQAGRERVYAIDPHTGDPGYLSGREKYSRRPFGVPPPPRSANGFSTLPAFTANLRRFGVADWVKPVVAPSAAAARTLDTGPIRLLYIDGLHSYEGVRADIEAWAPRVVRGGVIVFDDYFNEDEGVGVRRAVDELVESGAVESDLREASERLLVWTVRR
jgi:predicted O-methyltransferase YrrM